VIDRDECDQQKEEPLNYLSYTDRARTE